MQRPAAFLQEAGAAPGQEQVPPLMALPAGSDDAAKIAEYLLVDDLLTVMMGQVCGQHLCAVVPAAAAAGKPLQACLQSACANPASFACLWAKTCQVCCMFDAVFMFVCCK